MRSMQPAKVPVCCSLTTFPPTTTCAPGASSSRCGSGCAPGAATSSLTRKAAESVPTCARSTPGSSRSWRRSTGSRWGRSASRTKDRPCFGACSCRRSRVHFARTWRAKGNRPAEPADFGSKPPTGEVPLAAADRLEVHVALVDARSHEALGARSTLCGSISAGRNGRLNLSLRSLGGRLLVNGEGRSRNEGGESRNEGELAVDRHGVSPFPKFGETKRLD